MWFVLAWLLGTAAALAQSGAPNIRIVPPTVAGGDILIYFEAVDSTEGTYRIELDGQEYTGGITIGDGGTVGIALNRLSAGAHTIIIEYTGDNPAHNVPGVSLDFSLAVVASATTFAATPNPANAGEPIIFAATTTGAGGARPKGNVRFATGSESFVVTLDNLGVAKLSTSLAKGTHTVTASYGGDDVYSPSTDSRQVVVNARASALVLTASPNPAKVGETITFTATASGAFGTPTGDVTFDTGSGPVTVPLSGNGVAELSTSLAAGIHAVTASYGGDDIYDGSTDALSQEVGRRDSTLALTASPDPANAGDTITFTATASGTLGVPTGDVTFDAGGGPVTVPLDGAGIARFQTSLAAGTHAVSATYGGDGIYAGDTASVSQQVRALGSVTLRVETEGGDAVFGFSSATPALNASVTTSGGSGQSPAIALTHGTHAVAMDDMSGAGYALTALACSDTDSSTDVATRAARIVLDPGEAVTCTFTLANSAALTAALIEDFMQTSGRLLLTHQPHAERRIDRLQGVVSGGGGPGALLNYLPGALDGDIRIATSLSAIDALAGRQQPSAFDAWLEGTFALVEGTAGDGAFMRAAIGADYLVNPDLLVGGFVQIDRLSLLATNGTSEIAGTGWLAGPYLTARLSEALYLDVLAGFGTSANSVNPLGTYADTFDATRWLLSASLQGEWSAGSFTFAPRARLSYFGERADAYVDSLGITVPATGVDLGEIAIGPALRYRAALEGGTALNLGLRLEGVAELDAAGAGNPHGRIEASAGFGLPGGAQLGLGVTVDGLGSDRHHSIGGKVSVSAPLQ